MSDIRAGLREHGDKLGDALAAPAADGAGSSSEALQALRDDQARDQHLPLSV